MTITSALAAWGMLRSAGVLAAEIAAPDTGAIELLYHADLDGRFAQPDCRGGQPGGQPSYPQLLRVLAKARASAVASATPAPVALLGGNLAAPDLLGRTLLNQTNGGIATVGRLFALAGYEAVALGHHDLALDPFRLQALVDVLASHGASVVATNLTCKSDRAALCERTRRHVLVRRAGVTIGILATISPSVLAGLGSDARSGLALDETLPAVQAATRSLREQGASYVVLMAQGPRDRRGLDELDALQRGLAKASPGVATASSQSPDVILMGGLADDDGNRALELVRRAGAPPAVGSAMGPTALARVVLAKEADGRTTDVETHRIPVLRGERPAPEGASLEAEALLASAIAAYCRENQQVLATLRGSLSRDGLITYALEIMRRRSDAEVALVNRALVKTSPFPITGSMTRGQLYDAFPYKTVVGTARITGATLASLLGPVLDNSKAATVGLARKGSDLLVNGRPLEKARSYRVATISFVAAGGDDIIAGNAMPWRALPGDPDLRDAIAAFLRTETAREDGDPSVDPRTDFGRAPADRLLMVALSDGGLDVADTRIDNGPGYGDAQLARGKQQAWKAEWTGMLQTRQPRHESDSRLNLKYGWTRNQPAGGPASSTETADLITFTSVYNYRGLRADPALLRRLFPDPYARVGLESELSRPALSATQTRAFHHFELTNTVGALFTLTAALKVRGGAGIRKELLTSSAPAGRWRPVLEAGGTLSPTALATVGPLPVRAEGGVDYSFVDPTDAREHQLRASGKLSVPLLPLLFITVGLDVFAVQRQQHGWAASYDTTIGLRVHLDSARQWL